MKSHLIHLSLSLALVATSTLSLEGQEAEKSKPTRAKSLATAIKVSRPMVVSPPILSDSTDIFGKAFDPESLSPSLSSLETNPKAWQELQARGDGFFALPLNQSAKKGDKQSLYCQLYLLPRTYTKAKIAIETNAGWELYLDGKSQGKGAGLKAFADSIPAETQEITLNPQPYTLSLRLTPSSKADSLPDSLYLRIGLSPEREGNEVRLLSERLSYPSLDYQLYGSRLWRSSISPSGLYTIVKLYERDGETAPPRNYLYKNGRRVRELSDQMASAQWHPQQDKLYYDVEAGGKRTLYLLDPETGERSTLAKNIPSGTYYMTSKGDKLIYTPMTEGPAFQKSLDRFASPSERIKGARNRYFIASYDLSTGIYQPLTFGNRSTYLQDVSADGSKLLFSVSTPTPTKVPFRRTDFYELSLETMAVDTLFADTEGINSILYTDLKGKLLVSGSANAFDYIGSQLPKGQAVNTYDGQLFLYDRGTAQARALTKDFDPSVGRVSCSDSKPEAFFTAEEGDRISLYRINLQSGAITKLNHREDCVKSFSLSAQGNTISYIGQSAMSADRLYNVDTRSGRETLLYDLSAEKLKGVEIGTMKDWNWTSPDGSVIQGRYYLPANFDPKKKYPMIVYYYGGTAPVSRYFEGAYPLPMYAALGYVVYTLLPSGTPGYGQEFAARHINAWGDRTAAEIIGATRDFATQHSFVDASKIGCMGASYGGFMTQYLQTQTDLFAAAVSHAGISSISSYWGEGYWGVGYSTVASRDSYPWNNPKLYTEHSPLFLADKIHTPLLLIHGLADTNVPVGESWQMFNALRILGRPVEFVGVYGEDHYIADTAKRKEWSQAIMAFFAKYLQGDETWWDALFPNKNL